MDAAASFSVASEAYASNRPTYPAALFSWIASRCPNHERAWDCGAGNGQAATGLADHFDIVDATDVSAEQIGQGVQALNIRYSVQPAERTGFQDASFDLVAVAQALHWFDLEAFWSEVRRVAKPGAFFCGWGYSWFEADADVQAPFIDPILDILRPFWAPNNRLLWDGYRSDEIGFPFVREEPSPFRIELCWDIAQLLGYIRTWSAYKRARADERSARLISDLEAHASDALRHRGIMDIRMPVTIIAGRIA